jgi:hypothetical protein
LTLISLQYQPRGRAPVVFSMEAIARLIASRLRPVHFVVVAPAIAVAGHLVAAAHQFGRNGGIALRATAAPKT